MTARRYDISRALLTRWRKEYRECLLGREPSVAFAPVMIAESTGAEAPRSPAPEVSSADTLAITLVNGRQVVVPARIDPVLLARLLPVLDGS